MIIMLDLGAYMPEYAYEIDAGADLRQSIVTWNWLTAWTKQGAVTTGLEALGGDDI